MPGTNSASPRFPGRRLGTPASIERPADCGVPAARQTSVDPVGGVLVVEGNGAGAITGGFVLEIPPLPPPPQAAKIDIPRTEKPAERRAVNLTFLSYPITDFEGSTVPPG